MTEQQHPPWSLPAGPTWGSMELGSMRQHTDVRFNDIAQGMEKLDERAELRWRRQRALISGVALGLAVFLALMSLTLLGIRDIGVRVPLWVIGAYGVGLVGYGITRPYPKPRSRADELAQRVLDGSTAPVRGENINQGEPPGGPGEAVLGPRERLSRRGVALSDPHASDVENIEGDRRRLEGN